MEGLLGQPGTEVETDAPVRTEYRTIQRWLAFLFFVALGLLMMASLLEAAIP